jgi:glyoxylase-like metal-dependent hydrolase (beta-lactamase superfamily II)
MNDLRFSFRQLLKNPGFTAAVLVTPASYTVAALFFAQTVTSRTSAGPAIQHVQIAPLAVKSNVPEVTAQGRFLSPQAVSAIDISADGKIITIGTMAFSHDANVWQFAPDGTVIAKRHFPPWAPMQVATLPGGWAMAVGSAYSRVTSPDPTVWFGRSQDLMAANLKDELAEADSADGQFARLRPGAGDWRTGWFASSLGELFVRGPDWIFKPPARFLDAEGERQQLRYQDKNLLPTSRAMRMASSLDGSRVAFGRLGFSQNVPGLPTHADAVSVWQVKPNERLWSAPPSITNAPPALPDPVRDFGELAKSFRLASDALAPGHVTSAVALNRDGSRVAVVEYGVWGWARNAPAIGKWDPPIHLLNFLPKQRGRLRVFDGAGREVYREWLPAEGMFEIGFGSGPNEIWCWPATWFARGMAGAVWLPIDSPARTVYRFGIEDNSTAAFDFPDAVADFSFSPANGQALVSCWDGRIYFLNRAGEVSAKLDISRAARVAWSGDGAFAVVGTVEGRLLRFEQSGALSWSKAIPVTEVPPLTRPPSEVVVGLPIFQGGRIPQSEHAYVGDIWIIKAGRNAVLIDAGGLSGFSITQARLRALGLDRVTHVLHTHSHGDHCGGAYLWRAAGAQIVGPKSAELALTWLMPMLTDYGIYPPRPLDVALPLTQTGDETDFEVSGLKFRALFVPGHSFDLTIYKIELGGKRIAFTGDLGFENQDILHRCWGDTDKARSLVPVIRDKLLAWRPDIVFTGHGVRTNGTEFIASLLRHTEESLNERRASAKPAQTGTPGQP